MKKPTFKIPAQVSRRAAADDGTGAGPAVGSTAGTGTGTAGGPGGASSGLTRTTQSLLAAAVVLAVVFGVAELRPPAAASGAAGAATSAEVERTSLVCPQPLQGLTGTTALTGYAPAGAPATGGSGYVTDIVPPPAAPSPVPSASAPAADPAASPAAAPSAAPTATPSADAAPADARLVLAKPGVPAIAPAANGDTAPGSTATATGGYAPGFTVSQTTTVTEQRGLGLSGVTCGTAGTEFWFAGASTVADRTDYVSLTNPGSVPAVVDLRLYGDKGVIENDTASGITLAPGTSQSVLLSTISQGPVTDLAVRVFARTGRVGAALHAADGNRGADWVPASAAPAPVQVLPGLPADTASARLVVAAPADDDADLKIELSGKNGWFTPAGNESIHVKAGMVAAVDLGKVTRDEVASLRLSPSDDKHPTPVVAGLRVDRVGANGKSDAAWLSGAVPVGKRASVADNRGGGATTLYLTSSGEVATVRVSASAGSGGGTPATKEVEIPAGGTVGLPAPEPEGLNGTFAITVETLSGGPVMAARMLTVTAKDVAMFTVQSLADDHSTVRVPHADQDPGLLVR